MLTEEQFYKDLGFTESSGDYQKKRGSYAGMYQMGKDALIDVGYRKNDGSGEFTGKDGIYSIEDFLNNPRVQEKAIRMYHNKLWSYIKNEAQKVEGKYINNILMTKSGMIAGAHLRGASKMKKYILTNGKIEGDSNEYCDEIGTSIEDYLKKFANYDISSVINKTVSEIEKDFSPKNDIKSQPILPLKHSINKTTGYASAIDNSAENEKKFFTREEIAKMSSKEFSENEHEIMAQLKNGQIKSASKNVNYANYKNPETGLNKIFTREEIAKMSSEEYSKNEKAIMAQLKSIGIPNERDISDEIKNSSKNIKQNQNPTDGKWVTINGNHILLEK